MLRRGEIPAAPPPLFTEYSVQQLEASPGLGVDLLGLKEIGGICIAAGA